jgi:hypothetical protein
LKRGHSTLYRPLPKEKNRLADEVAIERVREPLAQLAELDKRREPLSSRWKSEGC